MAIEFGVDDEVAKLAVRVREFIDTVVIPHEADTAGQHGIPDDLRASLQRAAREAGLLAPHMPAELGGLGLDTRGQAVIFEQAGRSPLGPAALNCSAPDEGNMLLLDRVATAEQRERYLRPLAAGQTRSCFAMTEPAPGAGADPASLLTSAVKTAGGWSISGRKHFITGAAGAAFAIVMARTGEDAATMFLVDTDNPGMSVTRVIRTIDTTFSGGHAVVEFDDC
ncbi:MAG TPA: acyl-CoA dehydrogenase family protein, partial [Trebonia sp.]|nr:acyl-CoA dehydrogenase family protein [Trebonia sp.]